MEKLLSELPPAFMATPIRNWLVKNRKARAEIDFVDLEAVYRVF